MLATPIHTKEEKKRQVTLREVLFWVYWTNWHTLSCLTLRVIMVAATTYEVSESFGIKSIGASCSMPHSVMKVYTVLSRDHP